jgi:hypothetical protein
VPKPVIPVLAGLLADGEHRRREAAGAADDRADHETSG